MTISVPTTALSVNVAVEVASCVYVGLGLPRIGGSLKIFLLILTRDSPQNFVLQA